VFYGSQSGCWVEAIRDGHLGGACLAYLVFLFWEMVDDNDLGTERALCCFCRLPYLHVISQMR
jgi:hypothetical protein